MGELLTTQEAAQIMKRSQGHVKNLCSAGKLPGAQKVGRDWLIPREVAENFVPPPRGFAAQKAMGVKLGHRGQKV